MKRTPPATTAAVPLTTLLTPLIARASPSGSVSLARTSIVTAVLKLVTALSAAAVGLRLTGGAGATVTETVAVSPRPAASLML